METNQNNSVPDQKDENLWRIAKKRSKFKWSLLSYCAVNLMMVFLWFIGDQGHFWPVWCMIGWGFGLVFQYFDAYHSTGLFSTDKEYEKLKNQ